MTVIAPKQAHVRSRRRVIGALSLVACACLLLLSYTSGIASTFHNGCAQIATKIGLPTRALRRATSLYTPAHAHRIDNTSDNSVHIRLSGILEDDGRGACALRYPDGLSFGSDHREYLQQLRIFIVITLKNNQALAHHLLYELLRLAEDIGPSRVFISIYESDSSDLTSHFLALFRDVLRLSGIRHEVYTSLDAAAGNAVSGNNKAQQSSKDKPSASASPVAYSSSSRSLEDLEQTWEEEDNAPPLGHRIAKLAAIRNKSLRPLWRAYAATGERFDRVIFLNDVLVCHEDLVRLLLHKQDVACALDFDNNGAVGYYDTWVGRDRHGKHMNKPARFFNDKKDDALVQRGDLVPVFCCWNGALVVDAAPFYEGLRFRRGAPGECSASECSLFCKDLHVYHGRHRFVIDPHVRVAYESKTYAQLHDVKWMGQEAKDRAAVYDLWGRREECNSGGDDGTATEASAARQHTHANAGKGESFVDGCNTDALKDGIKGGITRLEPDIKYPPLPDSVRCCGLEAENRRDPDQKCVDEKLDWNKTVASRSSRSR